MICGPLMHNSPRSPNGCSTPSSLITFNVVPGTGRPTVPIRDWSPYGLVQATGEVSVRP
ncbi:hypothetical protein D9M71_704590 [compost metagenome]